jgi:hypothetical protein
MKINELVTPSLGKPTAATPPGTAAKPNAMSKVMNKFTPANIKQGVQNFLTGKPKAGQSDWRSKIGGALASLNKGAGVKDYNKPNIDTEKFNSFLGLLIKDFPNKEQEITQQIKNILNNQGKDQDSKVQMVQHIINFREKNPGVTLGDFNTEFRDVLDKLDIKPQEIKMAGDDEDATAAKPPGTSTILKPTGKPF